MQGGETKSYDLEDRTLNFARQVRNFAKSTSKTVARLDDIRQLVRSSGSVGANYIEANESLSKKDFLMRLKISRKEAKESIYWLKLLGSDNESSQDVSSLLKEAVELRNILSAIIGKSSRP